MFGYLFAKKDRMVLSVIPKVTSITNDEAIGENAVISGLPKEDDELAGFLLSNTEYKIGDTLPADIKVETLEPTPADTTARIQSLEEQLALTQKELLEARKENSSTMVALTTLFEMLIPMPPATEEGTTEEA
ncbi:hypothetical protein D3C76_934380 [compost metagenome]